MSESDGVGGAAGETGGRPRRSAVGAAVAFVKRYQGPIQYTVAVALLSAMLAGNWSRLAVLFDQEPHVGPFALMAVISAGCSAIQFTRWYILVHAAGLPVTARNTVRLGLVGLFYNTFLPGSVGGDLVKAFFIARGHPERKATAVATVVADRLVGLFGLILFAAAVGGGCWATGADDGKIAGNPKLQTIVLVAAGLATAGVLGYLGLGLLPPARAARFRGRLLGLRKVGPTLAELWDTARLYRERPGTVAAVVAMSAVVHTGFVLLFHLGVRVFPPTKASDLGTLPEHFVIAPVGYIVQALIPVPGGLGGGEFSFGKLYELLGKPESVGLAGRLVMRVVEWTFGLVGYVAFLRMRAELPVKEAEAGGVSGAATVPGA